MSRSWKRCNPRKQIKSKNLPKSRNRSKYKKWSVQRVEDEKSGLWVKCTSQSSQVPGRTSYGDEKEKFYPTLTDDRNSRLFRKNEYYLIISSYKRQPLVINCIVMFILCFMDTDFGFIILTLNFCEIESFF